MNDTARETTILSEDFNKIIGERKDDWLHEKRQKRQEDFRRIQDMKSTDGLEPLERFPEEMWKKLLDLIPSPEDKHSLVRVHGFFGDLLGNDLIRDVLFPLIASCALHHYWKNEPRKYNDFEEDSDEYLPFPLGHISELRSLSKSLRNSIDQRFEEDLLEDIRQNDWKLSASRTVRFRLIKRGDQKKLEKLLATLSDPLPDSERHLNFFKRSLTFSTGIGNFLGHHLPLENFTNFKRITNAILDHIGDQILHFHCDISAPEEFRLMGVTFPDYYMMLVEWLSRMKNLKWFGLTICICECESVKQSFAIPNETTLPPKLDFLERVDFDMAVGRNDTTQVCNAILSANPHVKMVYFWGIVNDLSRCVSPEILNALPLESLTVTVSSFFGDQNLDYGLLSHITDMNWPLKQLHLRLDMKTESVYSLFRLLNNFPTLEKLHLAVKNLNTGSRSDIAYLQLPNLHHFDIDFMPSRRLQMNHEAYFFFSFQFMFHAKQLRILKWTCEMTNMGKNEVTKLRRYLDTYEPPTGQFIKGFNGGWGAVTKSNIWDVYPWLELIETDVTIGTGIPNGRKEIHAKYRKRQLLNVRVDEFPKDRSDEHYEPAPSNLCF